jgi:DNA-binding transcriptional LysR family regulator
VPHALVGMKLQARVSDALIELLHRGEPVAVHARSRRRGGYTTRDDHIAFSRSIQSLEDGLGVRIFDRGTRSVRLTSSGLTLLKRARSMLAQAAELAREVEGLAQATRGTLAFGAGLMAIDGALAGLLPRLRTQSPQLRIDVAVGNWRQLQRQLEEERIEFFVGYPGALAADPEYTTVALPQEPTSIYCRPDHPLVTGPAAPSPHQLRDYAWANVATADNPRRSSPPTCFCSPGARGCWGMSRRDLSSTSAADSCRACRPRS